MALELPGIVRVSQTGVSAIVVSTGGTNPTNIPTNANLETPRVVRVFASNLCHIRFSTTQASNTCASTDMLISPNGGPEYFNTKGLSFYSACLDTSSATTAVVSIVPVEL